MTVGEYLQEKIDNATNNMIAAVKSADIDMANFWLNARRGFVDKRNKSALEELRSEKK